MDASLTIHAVALLSLYTLYGVFQEKILKGHYGPDQERFTSSAMLIVFNRTWSILVGLSIMFIQTRRSRSFTTGTSSQHQSFRERVRPTSHISAYAAVAVFNFLSTSCQYEALRYVSYSTQSLAKCAKVVPVLLIGSLVWGKAYRKREWIAAFVIVTGCGTYLFSQAPRTPLAAVVDEAETFWAGIAGGLFLVGYLAFDGLTSTTQERVFGRNPTTTNPFGPESPVLDQMVWVNLFAGAIAAASAVVTIAAGSFSANLRLLLSTPALMWDVTLFSMTSAIGLIVLLNTIASFGALTSSTIMTVRQFLSILVNAQVYGSAISFQGWTGIVTVGGGIWLKMYRGFDDASPKDSAAKPIGSSSSLSLEEETELKQLLGEEDFETGTLSSSSQHEGSK